jgi:hypothetical protein
MLIVVLVLRCWALFYKFLLIRHPVVSIDLFPASTGTVYKKVRVAVHISEAWQVVGNASSFLLFINFQPCHRTSFAGFSRLSK